MTDHREISELLPGLALGCLDSEDERLLKEHLAGCAECRGELGSLRGLVGELAASLPPSPPPSALEARILSALPSSRRQPRPRRLPLLAAAAIALVAVLGAGNIIQWQRARTADSGQSSTTLLTLALLGRGEGSASFGTVVLDPEDNEGVLAVRGLKALGPARVYQLWIAKGSLRSSAGLFTVDAHGYGSLILEVPSDFRGFESFLVTIEPRGGSASPSDAAVMQGRR